MICTPELLSEGFRNSNFKATCPQGFSNFEPFTLEGFVQCIHLRHGDRVNGCAGHNNKHKVSKAQDDRRMGYSRD